MIIRALPWRTILICNLQIFVQRFPANTKGATENRVKLYGKHEINTKIATKKHFLHKPIGII